MQIMGDIYLFPCVGEDMVMSQWLIYFSSYDGSWLSGLSVATVVFSA